MNTFISNLKVKGKLSFLFMTMLVLLGVTSVVSLTGFVMIQLDVSSFYDEDYQSRIDANQMLRAFERTQKYTYIGILENDQKQIEEYVDLAKEAAALLQENLAKLKLIYQGDVDLKKLEDKLAEIAPVRTQVLELTVAQRNDEAFVIAEDQWMPLVQEADSMLQELIADTAARGDSMMSALRTEVLVFIVVIIAVLITSILIGLLINAKTSKSILVPVEEIKEAANKLAEGDFALELEYESTDEFGDVVRALRNTVANQKAYLDDILSGITSIANKNLNVSDTVEIRGDFIPLKDGLKQTLKNLDYTMSELQSSATQVSQGAEQLSQTSQGLAEGATEQAGAVEELLATINDVTSQVEDNARSAADASTKADMVDKGAQKSSDMMTEMIKAMSRISETSKQIENIAKLIEDIASQTNLLSLNASIEAARAGEAGRGFAVVAGEISDLASQSAKAAANTRQLIEESIHEVESGNDIAGATSQALDEVRTGIGDIAHVIQQVMKASESQAEAMSQINIGIEQISSVIQNNAASAQESSATSEELSAQAQALTALAEEFVLIKK